MEIKCYHLGADMKMKYLYLYLFKLLLYCSEDFTDSKDDANFSFILREAYFEIVHLYILKLSRKGCSSTVHQHINWSQLLLSLRMKTPVQDFN